MDYTSQSFEILEAARYLLSNTKPSDWNEMRRVMTTDVSPFPGKFSYDRTPYLREPVDCLSPDHPARIVACMKGAQIGFSTGVIEAAIGWIIAENPGNILFLTGHSDLAEEAMNGKIDQMIDSCGLRPLIRPNVLRAKNMRTGDTNKSKEFPGGSLVSGSAGNHKLLRQRSVRYGFIDDFDAAKSSSKESGSTTEMIEQRFAAYAQKMKLFYISTPELKQTSNIEPVYLLGDQRRYHIHCEACTEPIFLEWSIDIDEKEKAGITYKLDNNNKLIKGSVGYICQKCGHFFTDAKKYELNLNGKWIPTAEPSQIGYYSYHISSLYAPPGMYDWEHYVRQYLEANPINEPVRQSKMKTFKNVVLGETWEDAGESPKANQLQQNTRNYEINIIPEKISQADGNGKIILITCACDLNGVVDDARLDYEIVGWSETGTSYSIMEGSIGTFIPREGALKNKADRLKWTYENYKPNNVWVEFEKIIKQTFKTDTGRKMRILITGVDTGHYDSFAWAFIQKTSSYIVGLKGDKEHKFIKFGVDIPNFKKSVSKDKLFLVQVNQLKDELADLMRLKWEEGRDEQQPNGFMNFPQPSGGSYTFKNFFAHYESEHRIIEKDKTGNGISSRWVKKDSVVQNHKWDCRVYNMALKDIITAAVCREMKLKSFGWVDFVAIFKGQM